MQSLQDMQSPEDSIDAPDSAPPASPHQKAFALPPSEEVIASSPREHVQRDLDALMKGISSLSVRRCQIDTASIFAEPLHSHQFRQSNWIPGSPERSRKRLKYAPRDQWNDGQLAPMKKVGAMR